MRTFLNTLRAFLASADTACAGYFLYCVKAYPEQKTYYLFEVLVSLILATWLIMDIEK